jgi:hypothetical protein
LFFASGLDNSPATGADYQGVYSSMSWAGVVLLTIGFNRNCHANCLSTNTWQTLPVFCAMCQMLLHNILQKMRLYGEAKYCGFYLK